MTGRSGPPRVERLAIASSPEDALFEVAGALPAPVLLDSTLAHAGAWTLLTAAPTVQIVDALPPWRPRSDKAVPRAVGSDLGPGPETAGPPFRAGWIGFLTYESSSFWNHDLATREGEAGVPGSFWSRYDAVLALRHADQSWWLTSSGNPGSEAAADALRACLERASRRASSREVDDGPPSTPSPGGGGSAVQADAGATWVGEMTSDVSVDEHAAQVRTIQEWIAKGHVYQVNLTYRARAPFRGSGLDLYPRLRRTSPVPFGAYLRADGLPAGGRSFEILAATPELFLSIEGGRIRTRPIKGTRPRDLLDPARDAALARALFSSPKDRAELTMIVDLERNDLGRLCRSGSVRTRAFPRLESYRGVHHLVADVEGDLHPGLSLREVLAATFPGGSVTGAPKIRAMELIREIESSPRGIYTGALGYLGDDGAAVLSLTIRTLWIPPGPNPELRLGVGGGIVTDSVPEDEWRETEDKARTLLEALRPGPLPRARRDHPVRAVRATSSA